MTEVVLPEPDPLQVACVDSPARYKLARWGRRVGKSRVMLVAGIMGHGPSVNGTPQWPGIAQGADVVWLALDYPQALSIWTEEIRPAFTGIAQLHESEHWCRVPGGGTLYVRSAENVDSIRGLGAKLGGVLLDECAKYDLEYAWATVIRPVLADNGGWAIFGSPTNSGWDGNALRRTPSYFNRLCLEQQADKLGSEWGQWSATTRQSYHIAPEEIGHLYADMGPAAAEELDAALITGGPGVWATEWRADLHVLPAVPQIPDWWTWYAGYDWGYYDGVFLVAAVGDGQVVVVDELHHQREHAELAGRHCADLCSRYAVEVIGADGSMWAQTAAKKGVGPTIGEEWSRGFIAQWEDLMVRRPEREQRHPPTITPTAHGAFARGTRSELLHRYLAWEMVNGRPTQPALRFVGSGCPYSIGTIPFLPVDPLRTNQPDTKAPDHSWDSCGYLLQVRPHGDERPAVGLPQDVHPGLTVRYERLKGQLQEMGMLEGGENLSPAKARRLARKR